MKILLVNTYDKGGAATACIRLHLGLLANGVESTLMVLHQSRYDLPNVKCFETFPPGFMKKLGQKAHRILKELKILSSEKYPQDREFLRSRYKRLEMFSFPFAEVDLMQSELYQKADIVHLHWVAGFLDYSQFFLHNQKPLVWTLHDMNPFSNGEHYEERFLGMDENGYPQRRDVHPKEAHWQQKVHQVKARAMAHTKSLRVVAPSHWLEKASSTSSLFQPYPHQVIPYGLPTEVFCPREKSFSRSLLGLPSDKIVLLFVADSIENARKGYAYLQQALAQLKRPDICLCAIGSRSDWRQKGQEVVELGKIQDERLMSVAYSAADCFIIPSLEDNLPNTVLESLACGTPVIGFPTGGILDMVQDGQNGYLCQEISVNALKEGIIRFLNNPSFFDRERIAADARRKYALDAQAQAYISLYREILR